MCLLMQATLLPETTCYFPAAGPRTENESRKSRVTRCRDPMPGIRASTPERHVLRNTIYSETPCTPKHTRLYIHKLLATVLASPRRLGQSVVSVRQISWDRGAQCEVHGGSDAIPPAALTTLLRLHQQREKGLSFNATTYSWKHNVSNIGTAPLVRTRRAQTNTQAHTDTIRTPTRRRTLVCGTSARAHAHITLASAYTCMDATAFRVPSGNFA